MLYQLSYCPRKGDWSALPAARRGRPRRELAVAAIASCQRVSLWVVCRRSWEQYFFISSRSRSLTLDFIVM